jgi:hypothetical protein
VSSRQEEKERRRQERLEREAAEQRAAASRRRIQLVGGVALAIAALAAIAFAGFTALSGGDDGPSTARSDTARAAAAKLPAQKETDVNVAAKTAGCDLVHPKYEGAGHEDRDFTPADYKTNPPTSGTHNPVVAEDGIYEPGNEPKLGNLVHTLEHGRIDIQYRPGTSAALISQLEGFVAENEGYHMVMFQNQTKMPFEVAATAWTHLLGCEKMNPQVWDALRTFRDAYIDKGPEKVP